MKTSSINTNEHLFWYNANIADLKPSEKCLICRSEFNASSTIVTHSYPKDLTIASKHLYHFQCINKAVMRQLFDSANAACPLCSTEIDHQSLKKIFIKQPQISEKEGISRLNLQRFDQTLNPIIINSRIKILEEEKIRLRGDILYLGNKLHLQEEMRKSQMKGLLKLERLMDQIFKIVFLATALCISSLILHYSQK